MRRLSKRNNVFLSLGKALLWPAVKTTSYKHYEMPDETLALMVDQRQHKDKSILYAGPHRSMWETIGVPYAISCYGGDLPFAFLGNNLIKKETGWKERVLKHVVERIGGIEVEREGNPYATLQSLVDTTSELLVQKRNIMVYPEGTRSRDGLVKPFKPAVFQGAIDAAKRGNETYVVPINVDYSHLIELQDFMEEQAERWTFKVSDSKRWRKTFIGDVYVSFGEPFRVLPDDDRKDLAARTRDASLGLVKIHPLNIMSAAIMRLEPRTNDDLNASALHDSIEDVLRRLEPHHDEYRGFSARRSPDEIVERSLLDVDVGLLPGYRLHANNIAHYLR